ncbi:hypothetical protein SUGI_1039830 [Cryptomeria japonica]|uniref:uncharacterized protein LOC131038490 n=1 Tax=Cryptomeria japonica TaxID=3369 RepID=UPI00241475E8|nr:uncharacterized protein LOC131038490 [Cryptomeria japonica]GLJ49235.1 hypothetical protein SUGI_1039830 [Cryptomeria japonica]
MECNKDEAVRAKEIAEKKFVGRDLMGAQKFALKAHHLYPELDGLAQMMAALEVHIAAENKVNGDMDWYGILNVNQFADEATVRKQYRKLALLLHPDKNKSVGADGAFKILSEAWSILSDRVKRLSYDQKRKGFQQRPSQPQKPASTTCPDGNASSVNNGFYNFNVFNSFTRCPTRQPAHAQTTAHPPTTASAPTHNPPTGPMPRPTPLAPRPPPQQRTTTFWTACPFCKMQYEYLRVYENQNLLCPNCKKAFCAVETTANNMSEPTPSGFQWSSNPRPSQGQQNYPNHSAYGTGTAGFASGPRVDSYQNLNNPWRPFTRPVGAATVSSATAAAAANVVQQTYEKVRREREEAQAAAKMKDQLQRKHSHLKKSSTEKHSRHVPGSIFPGTNQGTSVQMAATKGMLKSKKKRKRKTDSDSYDDSDDSAEEEFMQMHVEMNGKGMCGTSGHKSYQAGMNFDSRVDAAGEKTNNGYNGLHKDEQKQGAWDSCNVKTPNVSKFSKALGKPQWNRDFSSHDIRNVLMEKARMDIRKHLHEWKRTAERAAAAKASASLPITCSEEESKAVKTEMRETQNIPGVQQADDAKKATKLNDIIHSGNSLDDPDAKVADPVSMTVPDPDFYDFDRDRTEECFKENQVWAAYDDDDGMPRFYALIQKVASLNPFKLQISWLDARNNNDLAPIEWIDAGFTKTSGDFRAGKGRNQDNLNVFSHIIKWEKGPRGIIKIFPRKSDVWALYREWSPIWNQSTPEEVRHKYDMVQVETDFTEELGVSVIPLVKVAGYKTVFKKQVDPGTVRWVPKKELFRFSHQVPARILTGEEAEDIPKGCMELDPAATPLELLQVIKDEDCR